MFINITNDISNNSSYIITNVLPNGENSPWIPVACVFIAILVVVSLLYSYQKDRGGLGHTNTEETADFNFHESINSLQENVQSLYHRLKQYFNVLLYRISTSRQRPEDPDAYDDIQPDDGEFENDHDDDREACRPARTSSQLQQYGAMRNDTVI